MFSAHRAQHFCATLFVVACLVFVSAMPPAFARGGGKNEDARKGFDFGQDKPDGTRVEPDTPKPAPEPGPVAEPASTNPIDQEIARLRGWPDRKAMHAAEALFLRQAEAVPYLVRSLKEGDDAVHAGCAWVLGQIGDPVHVQVILGAAAKRPNASRADVFFKAAYALGARETKRWLISFLTVANRPVFRTKAADFLMTKVNQDDRDRVLALIESDKSAVRVAALKLLAPAGVEDVNERLIQSLSDLTPSVAYEAARLLAARVDEPLGKRLNEFARDAGARERAYATIVLVEHARATISNPFEKETVKEMSGRRGLLHPEPLTRGAAAVGLAYGGLDSRDETISALLDDTVVDVLIMTLGGKHFRDYASLTPNVFAALRRLTGRDLPDTAVAWAQWWRTNRASFRARRPLHELSPADVPRAWVRFDAIAANGSRMRAEFVPERGAERQGAFILRQRVFEGLADFLKGEGIFESEERGGVRADEHVAVTLGVLNQRKRMVITAGLLRGTETERADHDRRYQRMKMRMDALVAANRWQRYRDTDRWQDARAWWKTNVDAMAQASPDEQKALLQAAIVYAYDNLPDDRSRTEALTELERMEAVLTEAEARQLGQTLAAAPAFGRIEADGLRWIIEQGQPGVSEDIAKALAAREEPEAHEILAGLLLTGGVSRLREAFADERASMRAAAAHASRLFVEGGHLSQLSEEDRTRLNEKLRPGLEVLSLDDDPNVSIRALIALGYLGDVTVADKLENLYKGGSLGVKLEVTRAMGYLPGAGTHGFLTRVLAEERRDGRAAPLRAAALEAMARTGHRDAVRNLRYYLLNDKNPQVRAAAGRVMAELGTADARFALVEQLTAGVPDAARRASIVDVLGRFQGEVVPALMRRYLGDKDARVRAVAALRAAEHNMAEAFPFLIQLLRRGEGAQRDEAVTALENLTSERFGIKGYAALADRYELWYEDPRVKGQSERAWFREALRKKGYDVGPIGPYVKGEGEIGAVPTLIRVLRDDDAVIRRNAGVALRRIAGRDFGKIERNTPVRDVNRIADQWSYWYEQRKADANKRPGGR